MQLQYSTQIRICVVLCELKAQKLLVFDIFFTSKEFAFPAEKISSGSSRFRISVTHKKGETFFCPKIWSTKEKQEERQPFSWVLVFLWLIVLVHGSR